MELPVELEVIMASTRPVLNAVEELAEWADLSEGRLPAALHVDTGMNRLGLRMEEAVALPGSDLPARAGIDLLMSHLVGAEVPDDAVNARQIEAFARVRAALPGLPGSLANSSGIFLGAAAHVAGHAANGVGHRALVHARHDGVGEGAGRHIVVSLSDA